VQVLWFTHQPRHVSAWLAMMLHAHILMGCLLCCCHVFCVQVVTRMFRRHGFK
jgi:hypothetical protein